MKLIRKLKHIAGKKRLLAETAPERARAGSNFNAARKIGLVYKDQDEEFFNKVRTFSRYLKDNFGTRTVLAMGFVDETQKHLPVWQAQKLEFGFFTREDLNWYLKPVKKVKSFLAEDFDMLIDLSSGNEVPVNFILKESAALMKVGRNGSDAEQFCDFIIDMNASEPLDNYIKQLNIYLSNPKIQ
ncbi:MAG: hypothetical protein IT223_00540 [Crocinitomicaceae bacterium]|nr:hypothetical protein [Crocinitomicaceae bacterium]